MATNLQKEKHFLSLSRSMQNKADIKNVGKQSIEIKLPCGCKQTQHFACGKPSVKKDHWNYEELQSRRFQYFEFCKEHETVPKEILMLDTAS